MWASRLVLPKITFPKRPRDPLRDLAPILFPKLLGRGHEQAIRRASIDGSGHHIGIAIERDHGGIKMRMRCNALFISKVPRFYSINFDLSQL